MVHAAVSDSVKAGVLTTLAGGVLGATSMAITEAFDIENGDASLDKDVLTGMEVGAAAAVMNYACAGVVSMASPGLAALSTISFPAIEGALAGVIDPDNYGNHDGEMIASFYKGTMLSLLAYGGMSVFLFGVSLFMPCLRDEPNIQAILRNNMRVLDFGNDNDSLSDVERDAGDSSGHSSDATSFSSGDDGNHGHSPDYITNSNSCYSGFGSDAGSVPSPASVASSRYSGFGSEAGDSDSDSEDKGVIIKLPVPKSNEFRKKTENFAEKVSRWASNVSRFSEQPKRETRVI